MRYRKSLLIILIILIFIVFLPACESNNDIETELEEPNKEIIDEIVFDEGRHFRDGFYEADFYTKEINLDFVHLSIEKNCFESNDINKCINIILSDLKVLEESKYNIYLPEVIKIYIVSNTIKEVPQLANGELFCDYDSVIQGKWRPYLINACFGTNQMWMQIGLTEILYETVTNTENNSSTIRKTISEREIFSLFGAFFIEDYSADFIEYKRFAALYTKWLIDNKGFEYFITDCGKSLFEFSKDENFEIQECEDDNVELLDLFAYSTSEYQLVLESSNRAFYFRKCDQLSQAEDIYQLICNFFKGEKQLYDKLLSDLGEVDPILKNAKGKISIYFEFSNTPYLTAHGSFSKGEIHLYSMDDVANIYHELVHVLLGPASSAWISEAFAQYYPLFIDSEYYDHEWWGKICSTLNDLDSTYQKALEISNKSIIKSLTAEYTIMSECRLLYLKKKELPKTADDLDYQLFLESLGIACLNNVDTVRLIESGMIGTTVSQKSKSTSITENPNNFNYPEILVFMEFLMEKYEPITIFGFYTGNANFEDSFNTSYESMFEEFYYWAVNK